MNVEKNRLRTFESWPANAAVEPRRIAKGGFFSTGQGQEVQCFCCGGKISEWNYGDQVMARHRVLDPQCPFVKNPTQSGNVPLIPGETSAAPREEAPSSSQHPVVQNSTVGISGTLDERTLYRTEAARLESFRTWPIPFIVAPERLAKAGFYFMQQGDKVQCAFCSGVVAHWEAGDDPMQEHRRHFPLCPLHYNVPVGNVPLERDGVTAPEIRPFSAPEKSVDKLMERHNMSELGIQKHRGPRHPRYSTVESRLRTFTDWPSNISQTPQQLAQAGFYHVGTEDQVRCFHCDGGLRHWDPDDDPWMEHARWFSLCGYVRLVKGDEFVQQAIAQRPPILPAHLEEEMETRMAVQQHKIRDVTDEELQSLMSMPPALAGLQIGLDAARVRLALRRKLEQTGLPFTTSDALIEAALSMQANEEPHDLGSSSTSSSSADSRPISPSDNRDVMEDEQEEEERSVIVSKSPLNGSRSMPILSNQQQSDAVTDEQLTDESVRTIADCNAKSLPQLPSGDGKKDVSLEEEVRRLKEARLCKICMDEEVSVVFLPCGHLVTCVNCAPSLHDCPMCRQQIKATVRTFLS